MGALAKAQVMVVVVLAETMACRCRAAQMRRASLWSRPAAEEALLPKATAQVNTATC